MLRRLYQLVTLKAFFGTAFLKDKRGVSAIEFALVAPVLITAYLGMAELTLGMMASRHTAHLAATIGDLASQSDNLTDANINDLWSIGASMLEPFSTGPLLKIRLTCVTMDANNHAIVQWSDQSNWSVLTKGATVAQITNAQISPGESLLMTEVEYDYTSPLGNFLPGLTKFTDTFYHHPRNGTTITRSAS
ncbi:MAG: TadE/TadG family type IV pilus assembly protein [Asticcacaulis sp.]